MKHLDEIESFVNLVEKVSNIYEITPMEAHDYVLNYLRGNIQMDKEQLEKSRDREAAPKSNKELAEYVASHIRISPEDMLTIIEGIESGYNLNDNPIYTIADRDETIKSLKNTAQHRASAKKSLPDSFSYGDLTFEEFRGHLSDIGLSLCWDVDRETLSIGKREFANPMLWFNPRVERKDYNGSVQFKSINTPLFSKSQVYDAIRLVDSLLMTDLEKRGVPPTLEEEDLMSHYIKLVSDVTKESGNIVGNFLKSVLSRIDSENFFPEDILENHKVNTSEGALEFLEALSGKWRDFTKKEKTDIALTLAGRYQMFRLTILLEQLSKDKDIKGSCASKSSRESDCLKESSYRKALETIASETSCDDTWDYANRVLNGDGDNELPYRMNNK